MNCQYHEAEKTFGIACRISTDLEAGGNKVNKAVLHSEHCSLLFAQSKYTEVKLKLIPLYLSVAVLGRLNTSK